MSTSASGSGGAGSSSNRTPPSGGAGSSSNRPPPSGAAGSSSNRPPPSGGAGSRPPPYGGAGSSSNRPLSGRAGSSSNKPPLSGGAGSSSNRPPLVKEGLEFTKNENGITQIVLRNSRGATATVSTYGGQVLSWKTGRGEELLFVSNKATFTPPKAVRAGIPICFPQFGSRGAIEQHGFVRNRIWIIDQNPPALPWNFNGKVLVDLLLKPSEDDMKIWPHCFEFRLRISLAADGNLGLISRIRNVDGKNFSFSFAYHTYLSISDISEVRIEGLETLDYLDNLLQKQRFTEQGDALTFESEVDRVYIDSDNTVSVLDHQIKRTFVIRKYGLPDIAVWNPWERKSKSIEDLGDEEYKHMLCVDGAAVQRPIILKPGEEWTGRLELSILLSS